MTQQYLLIPIEWVKGILIIIGVAGLGLGIFSLTLPRHSIGLYQWMMLCFHWKVEPTDLTHEIRSTVIMGFIMTGLCLLSLGLLYLNPTGFW